MKHIIFISFILFFSLYVKGQVVTTIPNMVVEGEAVTLIFNAAEGTKGLQNYSGDVYAHIGVITDKSTGDSDWKYVASDWGQNLAKTKLEKIEANIYHLQIDNIREYFNVPEGEKVQKIAMVFRSDKEVGGAYLEGKEEGGKDIFVTVFDKTLTAEISYPKNGTLLMSNQEITIEGSGLEATELNLYLNDELIFTTNEDNFTHNITTPESGSHSLKLEASDSESTVAHEIYFYIHSTIEEGVMPKNLNFGVNFISDTEVTVVLQAPHKEYVYFLGDFNNWEPKPEYQMNKDGELFWLNIDNLTPNTVYAYQFYIDGELKLADPYSYLVLDPWNDKYITEDIFPNLKPYPVGKTDGIVSIFETAKQPYQWEISKFEIPPHENMNIYELHVRDFTTEGTLNAVIEKLDYIEELGINAIELMPFNEFEGNDSWGYNPSFYFASDKAYGTPDDYKQFVDECHKRGIAVIMDIVLNHSFSQSPLAQMYMDGGKTASNNPWYNREHNIKNPGLQWGHSFNHESPYTQALVDSILHFWMDEYNIDGFRFDFTKGFTNRVYPASSWASEYDASRVAILKRMVDEMWAVKPDAVAIFEHLADNEEEKELANYGILLWGNLNYNYAEAIMGYTSKSDVNWGSYKRRGWDEPNLVTYMESHDEERVTFKSLEYGDVKEDYNVKDLATTLNRHAAAAVYLFSTPGPKMVWQFGELGYDISIDENGRTGRKPVKWEYLDVPERAKLYDIYSQILNLRLTEDVFSTRDFTVTGASAIKRLKLNHADNNVRVVVNFSTKVQEVSVDFDHSGWWYSHFQGDSIFVADDSHTITLLPGEYRLFSQKKMDGFESNIIDRPDFSSNKLILYPTAVVDELNIITNELEADEIMIYSLTGNQALRMSFKNVVDISHLSPGQYVLSVTRNKGKSINQKFIKL